MGSQWFGTPMMWYPRYLGVSNHLAVHNVYMVKVYMYSLVKWYPNTIRQYSKLSLQLFCMNFPPHELNFHKLNLPWRAFWVTWYYQYLYLTIQLLLIIDMDRGELSDSPLHKGDPLLCYTGCIRCAHLVGIAYLTCTIVTCPFLIHRLEAIVPKIQASILFPYSPAP